jgi:hypothetical protein
MSSCGETRSKTSPPQGPAPDDGHIFCSLVAVHRWLTRDDYASARFIIFNSWFDFSAGELTGMLIIRIGVGPRGWTPRGLPLLVGWLGCGTGLQ